jgi:hypothetical protein
MATDDKALTVRCGTHGERSAAVVCGHLLRDTDWVLGVVENSSESTDLQGWCGDCEQMFLREGEMTTAFREFTDMNVVCDCCYARLRDRHSKSDKAVGV